MQGGPAEARSHGGLIEFALDHELRASIIKTEDLVVEIETIHGKAQATEHAGQERKVLDVSSFKAIDPSAAGVERLCHHGIGRKTRTCCRRIAGVCDNGVR